MGFPLVKFKAQDVQNILKELGRSEIVFYIIVIYVLQNDFPSELIYMLSL